MPKAEELVFSARFVEAEEALALGLVNHVVEDDELMSKTEELGRSSHFRARAGKKAVSRGRRT